MIYAIWAVSYDVPQPRRCVADGRNGNLRLYDLDDSVKGQMSSSVKGDWR